jgi:hypothetical protein
MYIPLGGAKYPYLNIWPIFTFVAIWHDTSFQLLAWGWLISLFFIPELLAVQLTKPLRVIFFLFYLLVINPVFLAQEIF